MTNQETFTLINPQSGHLAFKLSSLEDSNYFNQIQRLNHYAIIWIQKGNGNLKADFSEYEFSENTLFAFAPYQPFKFWRMKGSLLSETIWGGTNCCSVFSRDVVIKNIFRYETSSSC